MELCSMLYGSLDVRGVLGRMDTCICMTESLCCSPETTSTLLIGYTPKQNKKFNKNAHFTTLEIIQKLYCDNSDVNILI